MSLDGVKRLLGFELALDRFIAMELSVNDYSAASIFARDGLIAGGKVNDADPSMSRGNAAVLRHPVTLPVGTAMIETPSGPLQRCF